MATTETDAPIAIQLAKQLDGGYQEERDAAESLLDYLNEDGTVMDLSDHLGLLEARFKGLAYELASACALAQARVNDMRRESDEQWSREDQLAKGRAVLSRELKHIRRELTGAMRAFGIPDSTFPSPNEKQED
ncbi:hypothetical protein [Salinibacter ruber]|jgi:hypothetical protein|uniref:Uncharacterized protein n=1 Tax=Salinibacter ruber TaxID=146919 RepID=A0A9X2Q456_9BACT|nr:hypothetical protein [Salinibacter ruber]MCS3660070.1 hypothetical protein [Salinibacter ruber]MCS3709755.1 hypothetical protein [Salinibacter ruber]MCS4170417.1 hypothetical protein [Salinibacter ruber]